MLTAVAVVAAPPAAAWHGCDSLVFDGATGVVGATPPNTHFWTFGSNGTYKLSGVGVTFGPAVGTDCGAFPTCFPVSAPPAAVALLCVVNAGESVAVGVAVAGAAGAYQIHR